MNRLSFDSVIDLSTIYAAWFENKQNQRFGQFLVNNYGTDKDPWPELFYEENEEKVWRIVLRLIFQI